MLSEFEYLFPPTNRPPSAAETGLLPAIELSENERKVIDIIGREEAQVDEIIRGCGLPASAVSVTLLGLEMKKVIRQLPGRLYVRND